MAATFNEVYEWLEGPMADHFVCPVPPAASNSTGKGMCWLPDGIFLSDNLIELRQVRVKKESDYEVFYYTAAERRVRVSGGPVLHGGAFDKRNHYQGDGDGFWTLNSTGVPLKLPFEQHSYRQQINPQKNLNPVSRHGWYGTYEHAGFTLRSDALANKSAFLRQIAQLREVGWLDRYTRAVSISTVVLNPNNGLGALVTILVETPEDGVIRITPDVLVMQPRASGASPSGVDILNQHSFILNACFFFYSILTQLARWFHKFLEGRAYLKRPGNLVDWVIVLISGFVLVDFLIIDYRCPDLTGDDAGEQLLRAGYSMNYTMQRVSTISGMLLWMLILRALKFVPQLLGSRLNLFSHTVEKSAVDLLAFLGTALVVLCAFTCIFHFTLGTYLRELATLECIRLDVLETNPGPNPNANPSSRSSLASLQSGSPDYLSRLSLLAYLLYLLPVSRCVLYGHPRPLCSLGAPTLV